MNDQDPQRARNLQVLNSVATALKEIVLATIAQQLPRLAPPTAHDPRLARRLAIVAQIAAFTETLIVALGQDDPNTRQDVLPMIDALRDRLAAPVVH